MNLKSLNVFLILFWGSFLYADAKTNHVVSSPQIKNVSLFKFSFILKDSLNSDTSIFTNVEIVPEFPGGLSQFYRFLAVHVQYPKEARDKQIEGKVIVEFTVEKDGSLSAFKILKGVDPSLDQEAIRVLKSTPKWTPGMQNGTAVRSSYAVPISFYLAEKKNSIMPKN